MVGAITSGPPRHGGNIDDALKAYGGQAQDWLDLSTGISPWPYPANNIELDLWHKLPTAPENLITAASVYYNCEPSKISVSPGTQLAIRLLPSLLTQGQRVAVPSIGYQEHRYAWQRAGHKVVDYDCFDSLSSLTDNDAIDHAVVINPNNPSCELIDKNHLVTIAQKLVGVLIVDEAFADYDNAQSLVSTTQLDNILVLRSIGKYFGLAGARVGFVISNHPLARELNTLLQPWSINGAALAITEQALSDIQWQQQQTSRIKQQNQSLLELIAKHFNFLCKNQGLFTTLFADAQTLSRLQHKLAQQTIWTRLGDPCQGQNWLRLSLPGDHFQRLSDTLDCINLQN